MSTLISVLILRVADRRWFGVLPRHRQATQQRDLETRRPRHAAGWNGSSAAKSST